MTIHTAKVCTTNAEQFRDILELYVTRGSRILDMTWGRGVFWRGTKLTDYCLVQNDLDPQRGDYSFDFGALAIQWTDYFDVCVFDPPYKACGNLQVEDQYRNQAGAYRKVMTSYQRGIGEAARVLMLGGLLVVKSQDQVHGGRRRFYHHQIKDVLQDKGFRLVDELIYVREQARPQPSGRRQVHALSNHSYWQIAKLEEKNR